MGCEMPEVGDCGAESCRMQEWRRGGYLRARGKQSWLTMLCSSWLKGLSFVLEHGDCISQEEDNG